MAQFFQMSLYIIKHGFLTTLQDAGRAGWRGDGVPRGGAMDDFAHRVANLLVGNSPTCAVLEITLGDFAAELSHDALIAVCGGVQPPLVINGEPCETWRPVFVKQGSRVEIPARSNSTRVYLAVSGGFDVAPLLDSRSALLSLPLETLPGRALHNGDILNINQSSTFELLQEWRARANDKMFYAPRWRVSFNFVPPYSSQVGLRVVRGGEWERFTPTSRAAFLHDAFQVTPNANRQGAKLATAKPLALTQPYEMLSEAVAYGTIQVPPDGQPIILNADAHTLGGYPRIAHVITHDLPLLAQLKPRDTIYFVEVTHVEAHRLFITREHQLQQLKYHLNFSLTSPTYTKLSAC